MVVVLMRAVVPLQRLQSLAPLRSSNKVQKKIAKRVTQMEQDIHHVYLYLYSAQYLHVLQDSKRYVTHLTVQEHSPTFKLLTFL